LGCRSNIGDTVNHRIAIEDNGRVAINAVLHRLHQAVSGVFQFMAEFIVHTLKATKGSLFRGYGIRWQIFREFFLKSINAVYVVHSYTVRTIRDRVH
tara:strand:+ start:39067 stop:39357 length:291 start_codon:yes stop_codon:yes gene_type:complete